MSATGYSALSISTTAQAWYLACLAEYPKLAIHLPYGWTAMPGGNFDTNTRTEVFARMKIMLTESDLCYKHKAEYLARIYDSTELSNMEVYVCLALIFEKKRTFDGDYFDRLLKEYREKANNYLRQNHIQIDDTVSVTETDTDVKERTAPRVRFIRG
jgi:hypothetical protein